MAQWRPIACVLLPFAGGYYLSYLFRTINALIAGDLKDELGLGAADLGLLTSLYFLVIAAFQLPFGVLLDRYGPKLVQSVVLPIASLGALVFALADGLTGLIVGRVLIGIGLTTALMAGLKAIVLWFPPNRLALANGWFIMLGALGALTATAPAELIVQGLGWRGLFALLATLSALLALLVLVVVPDSTSSHHPGAKSTRAVSLSAIFHDARFWRMAPLSATGCAAAWSLQGLWAAPWLSDVEGFERSAVVQHLSVMAVAVCLSALLLGLAADRVRRSGKSIHLLLAGVVGLSMLAQVALLLGWPVSTYVAWTIIAAAGSANVLSFAILPEYFPKGASARANAALSLLHVGGAFVLQYAIGLIVEQWPQVAGKYPVEAHQAGLGFGLALQIAALVWFMAAPFAHRTPRRATIVVSRQVASSRAHPLALIAWTREVAQARQQAASWRMAAVASGILCAGLAGALSMTVSQSAAALHVMEPPLDLPERSFTEWVPLTDGLDAAEQPAIADAYLPSPQDHLVAGQSPDAGRSEQTLIESAPAAVIAGAEQKSTEGAEAAEVAAHVDQEDGPAIVGVSILDDQGGTVRQHRSRRPYENRRDRRVLSGRVPAAALQPPTSAGPRARSLRLRHAGTGISRRDAWARYGRSRDAHRGRGTLIGNA